jgi:A/G-specific adenine glycosylase
MQDNDSLTSAAEQSYFYQTITLKLLDWYRAAKRELPWRHTRDPYRIWVSEIMLQQTQVTTVIPYYERFLTRFPTIEALAQAELDEVLVVWQGLGYYTRARHLHAAARVVCQQYGGALPTDMGLLRALPGVGEYTAGAVASIAFGQDQPAIDANVTRVLCRLFDVDQPLSKAVTRRLLRQHAQRLLPAGQAGLFNQALMELGAILCAPRPCCEECPVEALCRAHALGIERARPVAPPRALAPARAFVVAWIEHRGGVLVVRRKPQGLLGGLWELPGGLVSDEDCATALAGQLRASLGVDVEIGVELLIVQHAYTHMRLTAHVYACTLRDTPTLQEGPWDALRWLHPDEQHALGLTGLTTKILKRLAWSPLDAADHD